MFKETDYVYVGQWAFLIFNIPASSGFTGVERYWQLSAGQVGHLGTGRKHLETQEENKAKKIRQEIEAGNQ